ncbi:uncharacterized protein PG986_014516 [Apiospora aurea]|uniref:Uncharacterized protein n=1 Tax=Apiospora aurea TaxID=335848 RepID=A0ABR1PTA2_9PEZI
MYLRRLLHICLVPAITAQRIFIDNLPGYQDLPPCAEVPVHTIVKDMSQGCGDHRKTTSYSCFLKSAKRCLPDTSTGLSQALDLFESYCAMGSAMNGTADRVCVGDAIRDDDSVQSECIPDRVAGCGFEPPNVARVAFRNRIGRCQIAIVL